MKFRGKIVDPGAVRQLTNLSITLSKLCNKFCVMRITTDKLYFVLSEDMGMPGNMLSWCTVEQKNIFNEFTMEGATSESNEIYLQISPSMMSTALTTAKNVLGAAKSVKIKLTNKKCPCLTFQIDLPTVTMNSRTCVHDIPVNLIPRSEWPLFQEPQDIPDSDMQLHMGSLKKVRTVVDRMKRLSPKLEVRGSSAGELRLSTDTDKGSFATFFRDLMVDCSPDLPLPSDGGTSQHVFLWLDVKKFAQFLASDQMNPDQITLGLVQERLMHITLSLDALKLHYFIPAISL